MARPRPVVAIDGPAGAGKSTTSRRVAQALGYTLVDTGSLYRAVALVAYERGTDPSDRSGVEHLAREAVKTGTLGLARVERGDGTGWVTEVRVHGVDPAGRIRTPAMSMGASAVSAHPGVREALLELQRAFGRDGGVVLEGRDIGTVVFPDAEVKIFLTASPEVRAMRRCDELAERGTPADYAAVLADVIQRDHQDTTRAIAPLCEASGAVRIDSSGIDQDEVVRRIVEVVRGRTV